MDDGPLEEAPSVGDTNTGPGSPDQRDDSRPPPPDSPVANRASAGVVALICGAALAALGSYLTWMDFAVANANLGGLEEFTADAWLGGVPGGWIALLGAGVATVAAVDLYWHPGPGKGLRVAVITGAVGLVLIALPFVELNHAEDELSSAVNEELGGNPFAPLVGGLTEIEMGHGGWLVALGGLVMLFGGGVAAVQGQAARSAIAGAEQRPPPPDNLA